MRKRGEKIRGKEGSRDGDEKRRKEERGGKEKVMEERKEKGEKETLDIEEESKVHF